MTSDLNYHKLYQIGDLLMSLFEFVTEHAILTDYDLDSYEGRRIWLVLTVSDNGGKDWFAAKVFWDHNGLYNHRGDKYGDTNNNRIIFCQNEKNKEEYFITQDFMPNVNNKISNLNSIFPSEDLADAFINSAILTRDKSSEELTKLLDNLIKDRSFAHSGSGAYSLFDMISVIDESILNAIPIFQKDL